MIRDVEASINKTEYRTTGVALITLVRGLNPRDPLSDRIAPASLVDVTRTHEVIQRRLNQVFVQRVGRVPPSNRCYVKVDDLVFVRTHPLSSKEKHITAKLCETARGPCRVKKILGPNTVVVCDVEDSDIEEVQNVKNLFHLMEPQRARRAKLTQVNKV